VNSVVRTPWLIRLALKAFPRAFRDVHASEMEDDYAEARSRCETRLSRVRFSVATAADLIVSGLGERRVARAMRRSHDGLTGWRRERSFVTFDDLLRDFRQALRALARRPGFSLVAVVTLALGIGANTAIFSVVNAVLLRPLQWVDSDRLVVVWAHGEENPEARGNMSGPDIDDIAELPAVESVVGYGSFTATVTSGEEPELVNAGRATDGLMATFGVRPFLGRDLTKEDQEIGRAPIVVVGHRYWQDQLGGRADVLGSTLEIADASFEIVGVAPAGFDFPGGAQLWIPRRLPSNCGRGCHTLRVIGRLADGATIESLSVQLRTLATTLAGRYPESNVGKRFRSVTLLDDQVGDVKRGLWLILGAVALVLLIACANVANLLLVRGESRRGEVAIRAALGASRARLAGQVLMESAALAAAGAAIGLGLARAAIEIVRLTAVGTVPRIEAVSLDGNVLLFTLGSAAVVTLLFGLSPALRQTRDLEAADLIAARGGTAAGASRARSLLLAAEVALSVLLLAGAGLMLKSFDQLYSVELGFGTDRLTRFRVSLPSARYDSISEIVTFYETLEARLAAIPGVTSVASVYGAPLGASRIEGDVRVEGRPRAEPGARMHASMHSITPAYFETLRIPVLRGRGIETTDRTRTLPVAVVSESFVNENFPGEDPIGKRFEVSADFGFGAPLWTIVGVAGDVRRSITAAPQADVYVPLGQYGPGQLTVTMRTASRSMPALGAVRDVLRAIDPGLPVMSYETVEDAVRQSVAPTRFYLLSMGIFAGLAVVLACVGLYGVVAYVVSRRRREIGIRVALGARRSQVVRLVLAQGLGPAAAGVVIGVGLALAFGRVAESLLFEVSPRDPLVMAAVVGVLTIVTFAASLLPARRASRVDPAVALREP
jgi:putative ABC transport system permease protein